MPGCNKNIYHIKVVSEGSKDDIEHKLSNIVGDSLKQICDPFCELVECDNCIDGCNKSCGCFTNESSRCFGFDDREEESIHKKIKLSKNFVNDCPCSRDHFKIDEWSSKEDFDKKEFIEELRGKVF